MADPRRFGPHRFVTSCIFACRRLSAHAPARHGQEEFRPLSALCGPCRAAAGKTVRLCSVQTRRESAGICGPLLFASQSMPTMSGPWRCRRSEQSCLIGRKAQPRKTAGLRCTQCWVAGLGRTAQRLPGQSASDACIARNVIPRLGPPVCCVQYAGREDVRTASQPMPIARSHCTQ